LAWKLTAWRSKVPVGPIVLKAVADSLTHPANSRIQTSPHASLQSLFIGGFITHIS